MEIVLYGMHYGQSHMYCRRCGHAVRVGALGCGSCMTPAAELFALDLALESAWIMPDEIGWDPLDGQFAVNIPGTDLAYEPATGEVDIQTPFGDIPIDVDPFDPFGI